MITALNVIDTGGPGGAETVFLHTTTRLDAARFRPVAVVSREGWLSARVRENGVEPLIVPASGSFHIGYLRSLLSTARQRNVDVIVAHLYGSAVYASLAGMISGIPVISVLHGQSDVQQTARFAAIKAAAVRRGSYKVVFVSENLREDLAGRLGLNDSRCAVIPNGVDTALFRPGRDRSIRSALGLPEDAILVGAVGNVRLPKAYEVLLQAAALLVKRCGRFHFVIAGDASGKLGESLLALRNRLGLDQRVTSLGLRPDVTTVLQNLDIFALSSRTEGFSIACIEAMACGVPVVATRSGGPQQILDERTGILVPVDRPEELAEGIYRVAFTPGLRDTLAEHGPRRVHEQFSLRKMLQSYENLLTEAVSPVEAPRPI
jgi:glycosyltransferase involved in cell wall biosynthesis